jgi:adenylate cyclase
MVFIHFANHLNRFRAVLNTAWRKVLFWLIVQEILPSEGLRRVRYRGLAWLCCVVVGFVIFSGILERGFGTVGFDALQRTFPRQPTVFPVVVVALDDLSLEKVGQWPWPRAQLAKLIDRIQEGRPLVLGVDILFSEPDRYSGQALIQAIPDLSPTLASTLQAMPAGDARLAQVMMAGPVVVSRAGVDVHGEMPPADLGAVRVEHGDVLGFHFPRYSGLLSSVAAVSMAASAHGLVSVELENGVARRMPLAGLIAEKIMMPSLSVAMLQQISPQGVLNFETGGLTGRVIQAARFDELRIPTAADGSAWIYFGARDARRLVSAVDVLSGKIAPDTFKDRLVLLGFTAMGLMDRVATPLHTEMPGVETHAQFLENILEQSHLSRPGWMVWCEVLLLGSLGAILVWVVPILRPGTAVVAWLLGATLAVIVAVVAFQWLYLFDSVSIAVLLTAHFGGVLGLTLMASERRRRQLAEDLLHQREAAARLDGELQAAQRVQMGMLPNLAQLPPDPRLDAAALMVPARTVGGDLFDLLKLSDDQWFFLIGDVSGKGLPASVFMALSKALCKSIALREQQAVEDVLFQANNEIARDNPESLFVTAIAGCLNLATGEVAMACAGHDSPYRINPAEGVLEHVVLDGGPPLCVWDDFPFPGESFQLQPGDALVLTTDGIQEAQNIRHELYTGARLEAVLKTVQPHSSAQVILEKVMGDMQTFAHGAEPADDATVLVLRWMGPNAH